jgi:hypothetical protein
MRMLVVASLVLGLMVVPAGAQSKKKVCKESCGPVITACEQQNEAAGFGTIVGKKCKRSVLKRCKQEGPEICQSFCGDGVVSGAEQCDGTELGGATCQSEGLVSGTLACGADCQFDVSGCETCGNGTVDDGEACDGSVPAGTTCASLGFDAGTPSCTTECAVSSDDCGTTRSITLDGFDMAGGGGVWLDIDGNSFAIDDGAGGDSTGAGDDAFDGAWNITVDAANFAPGDGPDSATLLSSVNAGTITTVTQPLSGLDVSAVVTAFQSSPTLRLILSFANPTGADIMSTITTDTNFGSDSDTVIEATSSGDLLFDTTDRWVVSSDGTSMSDPVNGSIFYGPGSPAATPTTATLVPPSDNVDTEFDITVPAGQTRYLMFFSQMSGSPTTGTMNAMTFDSNDDVDAVGLLGGLSEAQRGMILNWDL